MPFRRSLAPLAAALLLLVSVPQSDAQVVGSVWTSPTYGFSVSWAGTNWQNDPNGGLTAVGPERLDRLHLINGVSSLYFEGAERYQGVLPSCVAEEANILGQEPGVTDVRPYRDANGVQLVADSPNASAAAFTLTLAVSGGQLELVDYVECRTLIPGKAVLIITLISEPDTFTQELSSAQEVIDTITLAENIAASPLEAYGGLIAKAQERPSIAGPLSGELVFGPGMLGVARTGVEAPDFYARVEFANPKQSSVRAWDFGVGFRDGGGENQLRLVVDSAGNWFLKNGPGPVIAHGTLVDVDDSANGTNIIEIVAVGETGYFAFNERLVSELSLPADVAGGDVFAGAGFFTEDAVDHGTTIYRDLQVWSLSGVNAQESNEPAVAIDATTFAELRGAAIAGPPLAGPLAGELRQTIGAATTEAAGVSVEDFVATATFVNPSNAADEPWDFGIAFREQENGDHYRITVASDGSWEFQIGLQPDLSGGMLPAINYAEGASNTIEVVVSGETAGFSVNGQFVAQLDVSALRGAGDVWIGAGFHRADAAPDRVTRFDDFEVWSLGAAPSAPEEPAATPPPMVNEGTATPQPAPPESVATPRPPPSGVMPSQVALRLREQNNSGLDAIAVLHERDGRTSIGIIARGALGGESAALFAGTCANLSSAPLFELEPVDRDGNSETTIDARLNELNDGQHAIALFRGSSGNKVVAACGDIPVQA
jgi:hypothetical protein